MSPPSGRSGSPVTAGAGSGGAPQHVAIIMDGNGRWAKARGLPRTLGHRAGVNALKRTTEAAGQLGIKWLTVFGFSTENWSRPATEISELMGLLKAYVASDLERLHKENVRVHIIGRRVGLPADILDVIERAEERTRQNTGFNLQVAFNYGGRADIADAALRYARAVEEGRASSEGLSEPAFESYLSTAGGPPVDLIIRTSGERRLSNFLLWEAAYAELVFQDVLWPDYGHDSLAAALQEFRGRDRRYGGAQVDDVLAAG